MWRKRIQQVSQAPTLPAPKASEPKFDVADLYRGPVQVEAPGEAAEAPLDEKLRQAYFWITNLLGAGRFAALLLPYLLEVPEGAGAPLAWLDTEGCGASDAIRILDR